MCLIVKNKIYNWNCNNNSSPKNRLNFAIWKQCMFSYDCGWNEPCEILRWDLPSDWTHGEKLEGKVRWQETSGGLQEGCEWLCLQWAGLGRVIGSVVPPRLRVCSSSSRVWTRLCFMMGQCVYACVCVSVCQSGRGLCSPSVSAVSWGECVALLDVQSPRDACAAFLWASLCVMENPAFPSSWDRTTSTCLQHMTGGNMC